MRFTQKFIFTFLLLILFINIVIAQKKWRLEECIQYAYQNNLTIKRQILQTEIAENRLKQAYFDLMPDLGAGGSHNIGKGRVADYTSFSYSNDLNAGSLGIRSNFAIFNGFKKINLIKAERYSFLSMCEQLEKAKNDIALAIASAYLQILFDKENFEMAQNQVNISQQQLARARKMHEVGSIARGALLEIESSYKADLVTLTNARNRLMLSKLNLAQMLDLDSVEVFEVEIPTVMVPDTFAENPDSIFNIAVEKMPQIKSARYTLQQYDSQLAIAKGSRWPQISLTADYYTQYNLKARRIIDPTEPTVFETYPLKDQLQDKIYKQVSLNISIPIFTKYQIQTQITNSKIQKLDAEYLLRQQILSLRKEIEQAYMDALTAYHSFLARKNAVEAQEENYKYVQQKFDVGLISAIDYNIAKNNYIKVYSDFLQAKYQLVFNLKILEFYKGNSLKI